MIGSVVTALELRRDAMELLQTWMPSILFELAARNGLVAGDDVAADVRFPQTWTRLPNLEASVEDQFPVVVVTSDGTVAVARDGDGIYQATFRLTGYVAVRGETFEQVADLVGLYTAAMRVAIVQHLASTTPYVHTVAWLDEGYSELDATEARSLGAGMCSFDIRVGDVVEAYAGPEVPPTYQDPAAKLVASASTVITKGT